MISIFKIQLGTVISCLTLQKFEPYALLMPETFGHNRTHAPNRESKTTMNRDIFIHQYEESQNNNKAAAKEE